MSINSKALVWSTILVIWLIVAMTLAAELSAPFKAFIAQVGGHHWTGKSVVSLVAFILLYFLFSKAKESDTVLKSVWYVVWSVVLGGLVIFSFFLWHFVSG